MNEPEKTEVHLVLNPDQLNLMDVLIELADAAREAVAAHEHNRPLGARMKRLGAQVKRLESLMPSCPSS